jgi:hypothetical protein
VQYPVDVKNAAGAAGKNNERENNVRLISLDSDVTKGIKSLFVFEDKFCWGH